MDPTAITIWFLTSPPGQMLLILIITNSIKALLLPYDNAWRDAGAPLIAGLVGVVIGTVCGHILHQPLDEAGLLGAGYAILSGGTYKAVTAVRAKKATAPPPTPEA